MTYVNVATSLPRTLDVQISLSRPQTETRTNLNILAVVGKDLGFLPDTNRIRYYSTLDSVLSDFSSTDEVYKAAEAFFSQTPRSTTMAIAEMFETPQPAWMVATTLTVDDMVALKLVTDGSMKLFFSPALGGDVAATDITGLNFSTILASPTSLAVDLVSVAGIIDAAIQTATIPANCHVRTLPGGAQHLVVESTATGDTSLISFPMAAATGTFVGDTLRFTQTTGGKVLAGYTPGTVADELANIKNAANANGTYIYGWCFTADLRDVDTQVTAAEWALGQTAIMPLVTNDIAAVDSAYTLDLGSMLKATGNRRAVAIYHDDPAYYPDVSILAYMLHVNYQLQDSTVTAKFKPLPGIPTVQLTETQWNALKAKGYNTYTFVGNNARTFREGITEDTNYFLDSTINLDNFVEDLSVSVYNVFLRNKKVPYTAKGQLMLTDACRDIANQYTYNGTFADRLITDTTNKSGVSTLPAVAINPTPINQMSASDRALRVGPPIGLVCQEAGAIHSVAINVEVVN